MGWLKNAFATAGEVKSLTHEVGFLQGLLEAADKRNALLEATIIKERAAKDKVLLRHADIMTRQAKLGEHFVNDALPKLEIEPEPLTLQQSEAIEWAATQMRDADIEANIEPRPIEMYREAIKNDPNRYLPADILN